MRRKFLFLTAIVMACFAVALAQTAYADAPSPLNQVSLDVTVNSTGDLSIGGFNTKAFNLLPLDPSVAKMAKDLDSVHFTLQGDVVQVDVKGTPVIKVQWNPASRAALSKLAAQYGIRINAEVQARIEEWIASSNLDITARYSNDQSKPMTLKVAKPILVDLSQEGQLSVEKVPLAVNLDPTVVNTFKVGGIKNTSVCWNRGTLQTKIDGSELPSITLDSKGVTLVTRSLGLDLGNIEPIFGSNLGLDLSVAGAAHPTGATCGQ